MSADVPHSRQAEEAVIGALLIDPGAFNKIGDLLDASDFYLPSHRTIFTAIRSLAQAGQAYDVIAVADRLERSSTDDSGGFAYLSRLARETPTSANIKTYVEIVLTRATERRAIAIADDLTARCTEGNGQIHDALVDARTRLERLSAPSIIDTAHDRGQFKAIGVREFLELDIPPREYLLAPIIPEQGLVMIYGPRGLGKTQVSIGIAVAVACGGSFLRWRAQNPTGVLFIDGEMPASALQKRLADAIDAIECERDPLLKIITPDLTPGGMPDLSRPEGQKAVDACVTDATRMIIVDNLSSLVRTGVENDAESWQLLQTWALRHRAAGRSVLFIHHAGKSGAQRGTSRREDVLDTVIALRRPSDYQPSDGARFEVHVEKGRSLYGKDANPFEAQLGTDRDGKPQWTMADLDASRDTRIAEMVATGMKAPAIAQVLGISKATAYRHMPKSRAGVGKTGHA